MVNFFSSHDSLRPVSISYFRGKKISIIKKQQSLKSGQLMVSTSYHSLEPSKLKHKVRWERSPALVCLPHRHENLHSPKPRQKPGGLQASWFCVVGKSREGTFKVTGQAACLTSTRPVRDRHKKTTKNQTKQATIPKEQHPRLTSGLHMCSCTPTHTHIHVCTHKYT